MEKENNETLIDFSKEAPVQAPKSENPVNGFFIGKPQKKRKIPFSQKIHRQEEGFLNEFQKNLKYKQRKLWGEIPELNFFDPSQSYSKIPSIFAYKEPRDAFDTSSIENLEKSGYLTNIFDYRNFELDDIRKVILKPKKEYQKLFIDLNDRSLFYEKIHGELFLKRDQPQLNPGKPIINISSIKSPPEMRRNFYKFPLEN